MHGKTVDENVQERRFRALVEHGTEALALVGRDARLLYISPALARMFDPTDVDPLERIGLDWIHPEDRQRMWGLFFELVAKPGSSLSAEFRLLLGEGSFRWVEGVGVNLLEDAGVEAVVVTMRDITDRRVAEEALRDSEERYRVLFDQNPAPMWLYDAVTLRFLAVNEAAVKAYGYSREEFLSMSIKDVRPEEDVRRLLASLSDPAAGDFWRHRRKDGTVFDVEIVSHDVMFGGTPGRLVIAKDITQRRQAEEELRRAFEAERAATRQLRQVDEMKNAFLNAVSHELRTPLSAMIGTATTLERLGLDLTLDEQQEMLGAITANAVKLQRLLADLLDLDRLTRGVLKPRLVVTELGDLIRRLVGDSDFVHDRPVYVEASQMVLPIDPPKVERILENLLANAMKYSPTGTPIWVRVTRVPEGAVIAVEDCGPGVPEGLRESIFEPFRQGPNAQAHSPGVGIGLSLVARFAELHGGRAWWEERPGGGSSFRVFLREPSAPRREDFR